MNKKNDFFKISAGVMLLAVFALLALLVFASCNKEIDDDFGVGAPNYQAAIPTICPAPWRVPSGTEAHLATTTDGASIYYTNDGNDPTRDSTLFSGAITIEGQDGDVITIKAIAVQSGLTDSPVATFEYTIDNNISAPPTADETSVAKQTADDTGVDFTLTSGVDGTWKVYDSDGAPAVSSTVKAIYDAGAGKLTLSSIDGTTPIDPGKYYITVTEEGKEESGTLALTVLAPPVIINMGDIALSTGSGWEFNPTTHCYTITGDGEYTVTGDNSQMTPRSSLDVTAESSTVTLRDASIVFESGSGTSFTLSSGDTAVLLYGANTIIPPASGVGILVVPGASLTLDSAAASGATSGTLTVGGASGRIGIVNQGSITIDGGTINVTSGSNRAGIQNTTLSSIVTINGGVVNARNDSGDGHGIGAGPSVSGGTVTINGGIVNAAGSSAGLGGPNTTIEIHGGMVTSTFASTVEQPANGAGIEVTGSGSVNITGGTTAAVGGTGIKSAAGVSISGGTVIAKGNTGSGYGIEANTLSISGCPVVLASSYSADSSYSGPPADGSAGFLGGLAITPAIIAGTPNTIGGTVVFASNNLSVPAGGLLTVPAGWTIYLNGNNLSGSTNAALKAVIDSGAAAQVSGFSSYETTACGAIMGGTP